MLSSYGAYGATVDYYLIGFGSALNIETLVAAAERRETPIEVHQYVSVNILMRLILACMKH